MKSKTIFAAGAILLIFFFAIPMFAQQPITLPRASQQAKISQTVGLTNITIEYHRPGVKGREIWGALVPYGQVWRAGANENTTITFSKNVKVAGKEVPAGTYGLHMIPTENDWTVIFNKDHRAWGSFFYDETKDQLRFNAKPESDNHEEWLSYSFTDVQPNSATVAMRWEKISLPFKIEVETNKQVLADIEQQLTSLAGFGWLGWNQAANYCYTNGIAFEKAIQWVDRSMQINKNVTNTFTKALILRETGKNEESEKLKEEAFANAQENDINTLGYQLLFAGKVDEAIEVFEKNCKLNPDSWNVWDSLGEGYMNKGDKELAIKNYSKALEMAPENQQQRINGVLAQLQSK